MLIALSGFSGKMGESIRELAAHSYEIADFKSADLQKNKPDVTIDFSSPDQSLKVIKSCLELKIPLVIGTTGLHSNHLAKISDASNKIPICLDANFSPGVHKLISNIEAFLTSTKEKITGITINEIHHINKVDAPSGTALMIQKKILERFSDLNLNFNMHSERKGDVYGIHQVSLLDNESIVCTFEHKAESRIIFADGAIKAAKLLINKKPNLYSIKDFLPDLL
tara:strand:- start:3907 stop:4578 length:672 start_codon:yes stop_codon:yes gene_type:complete